jgi:hypothetical protein
MHPVFCVASFGRDYGLLAWDPIAASPKFFAAQDPKVCRAGCKNLRLPYALSVLGALQKLPLLHICSMSGDVKVFQLVEAIKNDEICLYLHLLVVALFEPVQDPAKAAFP